MAIIYSYPTVTPELGDLLIGAEMTGLGEDAPRTRTFTIDSVATLIANSMVGGIPGPIGTTGAIGPQGVIGYQGIQGVPGVVGPAGLNWQGYWAAGTSYVEDDAVGYDGASYFCIVPTSGIVPPDLDTANWALLASQGAQGPQGSPGLTGNQGIPGANGVIDDTDFVKNTADIYPSTPKITQVVSLTTAEYTAIPIKVSSTLYILI